MGGGGDQSAEEESLPGWRGSVACSGRGGEEASDPGHSDAYCRIEGPNTTRTRSIIWRADPRNAGARPSSVPQAVCGGRLGRRNGPQRAAPALGPKRRWRSPRSWGGYPAGRPSELPPVSPYLRESRHRASDSGSKFPAAAGILKSAVTNLKSAVTRILNDGDSQGTAGGGKGGGQYLCSTVT